MTEWVVAFVILFAPGDLPEGKNVRVYDHALRICKREFPEGRLAPLPPVEIKIITGVSFVTPHVWVCKRRVETT